MPQSIYALASVLQSYPILLCCEGRVAAGLGSVMVRAGVRHLAWATTIEELERFFNTNIAPLYGKGERSAPAWIIVVDSALGVDMNRLKAMTSIAFMEIIHHSGDRRTSGPLSLTAAYAGQEPILAFGQLLVLEDFVARCYEEFARRSALPR